MEDIKKGYTRVSTIINQWDLFGHIDPNILENKRQIGDEVHEAIWCYFSGHMPILEERSQKYFDSFKAWVEVTNPKIIAKEQRYYNDKMMVTGAVDLLVESDNGKVQVLDFKTSASASRGSWQLQGAFYHHLAKSDSHEMAQSVQFVQLKKDGSLPTIHEYKITKEIWQTALAALMTYRYLENNKMIKKPK